MRKEGRKEGKKQGEYRGGGGGGKGSNLERKRKGKLLCRAGLWDQRRPWPSPRFAGLQGATSPLLLFIKEKSTTGDPSLPLRPPPIAARNILLPFSLPSGTLS